MLEQLLRIDLLEGNAVNVEVEINSPVKGAGSRETSANFYVYNPSRM
jgi:hypothetical protein